LPLFLAPLALALPASQSDLQDLDSVSPEVTQGGETGIDAASCPKYGGPSKPQDLQACQYESYETDQWLHQYIQNLLKKNGVTSTQQLQDAWPAYLWRDYQKTSGDWSCSFHKCSNPPAWPAETASTDEINAFFVLQSVNRWTQYVHALNQVPILSYHRFLGVGSDISLYSILRDFTPDETRRPLDVNSRKCDANILYQVVISVLGQFPRPASASPGVNGFKYITGWLGWPQYPAEYTFDKITSTFADMPSKFSAPLSDAFNGYLKHYDFARDFLSDGGFLPELSQSVSQAWNNPAVRISARFWTDFRPGSRRLQSPAIHNGQSGKSGNTTGISRSHQSSLSIEFSSMLKTHRVTETPNSSIKISRDRSVNKG
jgi:hypothetical protein